MPEKDKLEADSGFLRRIRNGEDPLAGLRKYLAHGGSLREAERLTGVKRSTLQRYLAQGLPGSASDLLTLIAAFRQDGRIRD